MAKLIAEGLYGQLELNKVAFRRDGRIEAQCKLGDGVNQVENGMILAIDPVNHTVNFPTGDDEFLALNYTTEHMYDEREHGLRHFVLKKGEFLPRLGYLAAGDIFTTNSVVYDIELEDAKYGYADETGYIRVKADNNDKKAIVKVVAITTMPDGSPAVKFIAL